MRRHPDGLVGTEEERAEQAPDPGPENHSGLPERLVVFDGLCNLCDGFVRWVVDRDRAGLYVFTPLQGETASRLDFDVVSGAVTGRAGRRVGGEAPAAGETILLVDDGVVFDQSDAVLRIVGGLGGLWRPASSLRLIPRGLRNACYRWVARNRIGWFGKRESCRIPTPAEAARFLP